MAEVLGVVAGIVGVLDVGAKVSSKLNKARKTWKNAAAELSALQDDLDYFRLVLNELKNAWDSLQGVIGNDVLQTIVTYMADAKTSLADLDCIIDSFDNLTETKRRKKWLVQKSAIELKMAQLGRIRAKVYGVLKICGTNITLRKNFELIARLEAYEAAIRSALQPPTGFVIDDESQPDPAPSINDNGTQTTVTTPSNAPLEATDWSVKYRNPDRLCEDSCTCGCHTVPVQHSLWSTPKILSGLTGVLRGSTTWVPRWTPPCNVDTCLRQTKSEYRLQFELPRWIAIYSLDALVQRQLGQPLTFGLKFRPRVNDSWLFTRFIIHDISRINDLV